MKRICIVAICILFCLGVTCSIPIFAHAASNEYYTSPDESYYLIPIIYNGEIVGVRYCGYCFGASGIEVAVDLYSNESLAIDFNVASANLSVEQLQVKSKIIHLFNQVTAFIDEIDLAVNTQYDGTDGKPLSFVAAYNAAKEGDSVELGTHEVNMLSIAKQAYDLTDGAFNPAVYRLVDLWGFSTRIFANGQFGLPYDRPVSSEEFSQNGYPLPDDKFVRAFSADEHLKFDFDEKSLISQVEQGKTVYFWQKTAKSTTVDGVEYQQWIDLGGVAKGYVADEICNMVREVGFDGYVIDVGTSSIRMGNNVVGKSNLLSFVNAFDKKASVDPQSLFGLQVRNVSASTSGAYVRKYTVNGVEYNHIIDGKSGAPAQNGVLSASVIASDVYSSALCDCLTTALTVMDFDQITAFYNGYALQNGITVALMCKTTKGAKQLLVNVDESQIVSESDALEDVAFALKRTESGWEYDVNAQVAGTHGSLMWMAVVIAVVVACAALAIVICHVVKKKKGEGVLAYKTDKPFKSGDVVVYIAVALCLAILFLSVLQSTDKTGGEPISVIKVVDMSSGQTIFAYDVLTGKIQTEPSESRTMSVDRQADKIVVTVTYKQQGKNVFTIAFDGGNVSVEMTDATCGFHKDCVRSFGKIGNANEVIVCNPNRLKIITE